MDTDNRHGSRTRNMNTRVNGKVQSWEFQENWKTGSEQQGAAFPEISGPFGRGVMKGREDNMVYGSSSFSSLM